MRATELGLSDLAMLLGPDHTGAEVCMAAAEEIGSLRSRLAAAEAARDGLDKTCSALLDLANERQNRIARLEAALRGLVEIQPASEAWPNYKRTVLAEARAALAEGDHE